MKSALFPLFLYKMSFPRLEKTVFLTAHVLLDQLPTSRNAEILSLPIYSLLSKDPGHIIATTACLGSEVNIHLLKIKAFEETGDSQSIKQHKLKIHEFITWCIEVFGKDKFFIELQPALSEEQIYCNKKLIDSLQSSRQ